MTGLNKALMAMILLTGIGCKQSSDAIHIDESNSDSVFVQKIVSSTRRALGESAIEHYKDYDFYLFYADAGPWKVSKFFSMRLRDSILFSYTKYMDNVSSTHFPPTGDKEPISYMVTYREYSLKVLDTITSLLKESDFFKLPEQPNTAGNHNSRGLFIYSKGKGCNSLGNWQAGSHIGKLVQYIRDSLMKYSPRIDSEYYKTKIK